MKTKRFGTLAVVGAYSGFVLEERGFSGIHEVFDFFYPGIMTLGVSAMSDNIKLLLQGCDSRLINYDKSETEDWKDFAKRAVLELGETIELVSPGNDADFDGLATELEYIKKHRPDMPVIFVETPEPPARPL